MSEQLRNRLSIALAIIIGSLVLTDCFGGHVEHVQGTLAGHHYTPAYTSIDCTTTDKKTTCHPVYHPAEYDLYVQSTEGLAWVSTNAAGYATTHDGQAITYRRVRTRWTNYTWGNSYGY